VKHYKVLIGKAALLDIRDAKGWYNKCLPNLGSYFHDVVKKQISTLSKNGGIYVVRYKSVHCMPVKKFPYLVHFTINENKGAIEVFAVIHTSRSPDIWDQKTNDFKN